MVKDETKKNSYAVRPTYAIAKIHEKVSLKRAKSLW